MKNYKSILLTGFTLASIMTPPARADIYYADQISEKALEKHESADDHKIDLMKKKLAKVTDPDLAMLWNSAEAETGVMIVRFNHNKNSMNATAGGAEGSVLFHLQDGRKKLVIGAESNEFDKLYALAWHKYALLAEQKGVLPTAGQMAGMSPKEMVIARSLGEAAVTYYAMKHTRMVSANDETTNLKPRYTMFSRIDNNMREQEATGTNGKVEQEYAAIVNLSYYLADISGNVKRWLQDQQDAKNSRQTGSDFTQKLPSEILAALFPSQSYQKAASVLSAGDRANISGLLHKSIKPECFSSNAGTDRANSLSNSLRQYDCGK